MRTIAINLNVPDELAVQLNDLSPALVERSFLKALELVVRQSHIATQRNEGTDAAPVRPTPPKSATVRELKVALARLEGNVPVSEFQLLESDRIPPYVYVENSATERLAEAFVDTALGVAAEILQSTVSELEAGDIPTYYRNNKQKQAFCDWYRSSSEEQKDLIRSFAADCFDHGWFSMMNILDNGETILLEDGRPVTLSLYAHIHNDNDIFAESTEPAVLLNPMDGSADDLHDLYSNMRDERAAENNV